MRERHPDGCLFFIDAELRTQNSEPGYWIFSFQFLIFILKKIHSPCSFITFAKNKNYVAKLCRLGCQSLHFSYR